jgi:omega-hydroxy-beta-dihydromenaquinone-9 sulfotransferase
MFVDFENYRRLARGTFNPNDFSLRYATLLSAALACAVGPATLINATLLTADSVLYPGVKDHPMSGPIFIVANPRSGTTFLHRLMAMDEDRFASMRLWQTMFPSVSAQRGLRAIWKFDQKVGAPLTRVVKGVERLVFGGWEGVHDMGFERTEEDESVFYMMNVTASAMLTHIVPDAFERLGIFDDMPADWRAKVMDNYDTFVRSYLYAGNETRTYLCKNVFSSGRVRSLREQYPDARFIHIVRHPYEAIPSFCSMFSMPWKVLRPEIEPDSDTTRTWARIATAFYRHLHDVRAEMPPEKFISVRYDDLVRRPVETVEAIYQRFDLLMTPDLRERLHQEVALRSGYESRHTYSLETFGLSAAQIQEDLGDIFDEYGFSREYSDMNSAAQ